MKPYRDWKIRSKLLIPVVAMGLASSLAVIATAVVVFRDLRDHTIVELEAAFAMQSAVIELVGDYRDYLNLPSPSVLAEIDQTKSEVIAAFNHLDGQLRTRPIGFAAAPERIEASGRERLAPVEADIARLTMLGTRVVAVRDAITASLMELEEFEEAINATAESLHAAVAELMERSVRSSGLEAAARESLAQTRALGRLTTASQAYVSETREYILTPERGPQSDLTEYEEDIKRSFSGLESTAARIAAEPSPVEEMSTLLAELTILSDATVEQRDALSTARIDLELAAAEFQIDLGGLTNSFSNEADVAVRNGLMILAAVVASTVLLTGLTHWWVSEGIARPIGQLRTAAAELGSGNLDTRSTLDRNDDVGELATAFNEMAGNLSANISALKAAQEDLVRKERLAAVGQLTATVSHELRNPLGAMRSATEAIAKLADQEKPQLARAIALLDRGQARCDRIIAELLDFARVRDLERTPTDVDSWLGTLLDEYDLPPTISLVRHLKSGAELALDRDRMERSVHNVLDNACQAMGSNETTEQNGWVGELTVATGLAGDRLQVSIGDTGPGIPATEISKVFEPLFSTKSIGVGLGLPMVKQIMEQHGGGIEIVSETDGGTEVVLWLPVSGSEMGGTEK